MSKPEPSHKDKHQLVAELEALHRSLSPEANIPVLVEAVLDSEEEVPDLAVQIDLVDSLLAEQPAAAVKTAPAELQLDLGYDLFDAAESPLPEDPNANERLSQVHNDPLNYTGDDLFINHEDRESHFTDEPVDAEDQDEPPLLELENALPLTETGTHPAENIPAELSMAAVSTGAVSTAVVSTGAESSAAKLDTVFKALHNPTDDQDDENPFLPAHLREKLRRSKATLIEEIQRSSDAVHQSSALIKAYTSDSQLKHRDRASNPPAPQKELPKEIEPNQALIDELVAEFLPQIEAKLRQKLAAQLAQKPLPPNK